MKSIDYLKILLNNINYSKQNKERKMKRVFQLNRYLKWNELTSEEKLSFKRILLLPLFAYIILTFFNQNFLLIVVLLFLYVLYKKFDRTNIIKK